MGSGVSQPYKEAILTAATKGDGFRLGQMLKSLGKSKAGRLVGSLRASDGSALLQLAVRSQDESTVDALLVYSADPNIRSGQARVTPLHSLAQVSNDLSALAMARSLVEAKADINAVNLFHQSPLFMLAPRKAPLPVVRFLLDKGADLNLYCRHFSRSLLMEYFMQCEDIPSISHLIDRGAEVQDKEREMVLHQAASSQNEALLQLILERTGAGKPHIEAPNSFGDNSLHLVANAAHPSLSSAKLLLDCEADLELVNVKGDTALLKALTVNKTPNLALYLLECKADPNHSTPSNATPLMVACRECKEPRMVVDALIARGANTSHQENVTRYTALHILALRDDCDTPSVVETAQSLLKAGCKSGTKDADGRLALHLAYQSAGRAKKGVNGGPLLQLLLSYSQGNDVYEQDNEGLKPREVYDEPDEFIFNIGMEPNEGMFDAIPNMDVYIPGKQDPQARTPPKADKSPVDKKGKASPEEVRDSMRVDEYLQSIRERAEFEAARGGRIQHSRGSNPVTASSRQSSQAPQPVLFHSIASGPPSQQLLASNLGNKNQKQHIQTFYQDGPAVPKPPPAMDQALITSLGRPKRDNRAGFRSVTATPASGSYYSESYYSVTPSNG